jgi:hypothetical protein
VEPSLSNNPLHGTAASPPSRSQRPSALAERLRADREMAAGGDRDAASEDS